MDKAVPLPVYAVDEIAKEIGLFQKEARFFKSSSAAANAAAASKGGGGKDAKKLLKSMNFVVSSSHQF